MPKLIQAPAIVEAAGNKPKRIEEFAGRINTNHDAVSVARMQSPAGWVEPGQRPEFLEVSIVLKGILTVESESETFVVKAGQGVVAARGEWVRYSTPEPGGAHCGVSAGILHGHC